ncbi:MAG: hypothetical protein JEZ06_14060 [Anaerolineaceae bacterium]|nr:hypothetical protein [Anaerolineaceae bacterium]
MKFKIIVVIILVLIISACGFSEITNLINPSNSSEDVAIPDAPIETASTEEIITEATPDPSENEAEPAIENESVEDNPCNNVFYPMVKDNQWIYQVNAEEDSGQVGLTVSEQSGNQATVDAINIDTGLINQTLVTCDQGAINNFPMLTLSLIFGEFVDGGFELEYISGTFSPAYQQFIDSNWDLTWDGEYTIKGDLRVTDEEEEITVQLHEAPLRMKWETGDNGQPTRESITVAAGTYPEAIKVSRELEMDVSVTMDSMGDSISVDSVLILETTLWYEPYIGLLKQQIDSGDIIFKGMKFPIELDGTLELKEFRSAN